MRTRALVWAAIVGLATEVAVQAQGGSNLPPKLHLVARNVYMLESENAKPTYGSNVAVLIGDDGALVVDAQGRPDAQPVIAAIKSISEKPIRYLINTHCPGDHTGGNAGFQRAGATIVAHGNVRRRMEEGKCDQQTVLPTLTFGNSLTLYFDDEEVRIIKLPTGHTDGDALVYFERAHVVATGDTFTSNGPPLYSKYAGGNQLGINDELHEIIALLPEDVKIIPGHGSLASMSAVRAASEALDGIRDVVAAEIAKGNTLIQIQT